MNVFKWFCKHYSSFCFWLLLLANINEIMKLLLLFCVTSTNEKKNHRTKERERDVKTLLTNIYSCVCEWVVGGGLRQKGISIIIIIIMMIKDENWYPHHHHRYDMIYDEKFAILILNFISLSIIYHIWLDWNVEIIEMIIMMMILMMMKKMRSKAEYSILDFEFSKIKIKSKSYSIYYYNMIMMMMMFLIQFFSPIFCLLSVLSELFKRK